MDFLLGEVETVVELKMPRERLGDKELGDELVQDIAGLYRLTHDAGGGVNPSDRLSRAFGDQAG